MIILSKTYNSKFQNTQERVSVVNICDSKINLMVYEILEDHTSLPDMLNIMLTG